MTPNDFDDFYAAWVDVCEMSAGNKTPSDRIVSRAFDMLIEYKIQLVLSAITAHGKRQRFAPTVPDIIEIINEGTGNKHLEPAEAWGRFPKTGSDSAMVTPEMLAAWDVAEDLYVKKQFFAAEKAFIAAYTRLISESNLRGTPVVKTLSKGTDQLILQRVVKEAVARGELTQSYAKDVLASLPAPASINNPVTGLIAGKAPKNTNGLSSIAKQCISEILQNFDEADKQIEIARQQAREAERNRRDAMIQDALMELSQEEQALLKQAHFERHGNEVLH